MIGVLFERIFKFTVDRLPTIPKCETCGVRMEYRCETPQLFLIPVFSDHTYKVCEEYYLSNMQPISSMAEIPTGQRACKLHVIQCPQCAKKLVRIEDFLKVRDTEVFENLEFYEYSHFQQFIQGF